MQYEPGTAAGCMSSGGAECSVSQAVQLAVCEACMHREPGSAAGSMSGSGPEYSVSQAVQLPVSQVVGLNTV